MSRVFKPQGKPAVSKRKSAQKARITAARQTVRRHNAQSNLAAFLSAPREKKTFDPVTLATNNLRLSSDAAVATSAGSFITADSSAMVLNQVPQGTTSTSRIGRKIRMTGIRIVGRIANTATSAAYNQVRLSLVYVPRLDRNQTTMPPQTAIYTTQDPSSLRVINNSDRYTVIRTWTHQLFGDIDAVNTGQEAISIDEMIPLNHLTSWLQANTNGSFTEMEEGALCLYGQGINTNASNLYATFVYSARLYFDDL